MSQSRVQVGLFSPIGPRGLSLIAAGLLFTGSAAQAATVSKNTGSLGAPANGSNSDTVTAGPGVVAAGSDGAVVYNNNGATNTTVPFQSGLNPTVANPFTIEFWARPTATDNDDAPVSNRVTAGNRSGWVFFQRNEATGWNFRMYNGVGSALGWDLTGGTANLNSWNHVVATWNGTAAQLFVNGLLADSSNDPAATGVYNVNTTGPLTVGSIDGGGSPYAGSIDEVAFYPSVLTPAQIASHFAWATDPGIASAYQQQVRLDGAALQLSNDPVPEPSSMLLLGAGGVALLRRRRAR